MRSLGGTRISRSVSKFSSSASTSSPGSHPDARKRAIVSPTARRSAFVAWRYGNAIRMRAMSCIASLRMRRDRSGARRRSEFRACCRRRDHFEHVRHSCARGLHPRGRTSPSLEAIVLESVTISAESLGACRTKTTPRNARGFRLFDAEYHADRRGQVRSLHRRGASGFLQGP